MALRRKLIFQPDICEWLQSNRNQVAVIRKQRYALDKGLLGAMRDFFPSKPSEKETESTSSEEKNAPRTNTGLDQYYESEELIKRMKWKRVTWDEDADYTSFSRRVLNNDSMFKNVSAFSFMSIHVVKDPLTSNLVNIQRGEKVVKPGDITSLFLKEREAVKIERYLPSVNSVKLSPFSVDWISGSVHILDTASPQEVLTFLTTVAPRLQALQVKMEEQQERINQDIKRVNVRVGASLKFNEFNTTFWDDARRKTDPGYINPDDLEQFLSGMLKSAFLFRWFLRGTEIKVLPAGNYYHCDTQKNEIHIPVNFSDFNWLSIHSRFQAMERVANRFRKFWWFWFAAGLVVVGDVDFL